MNTSALLVGLGDVYNSQINTWSNISFSINNILWFAEFLRTTGTTNILIEKNASSKNITSSLSSFIDSEAKKVIFYYVGHSSKSQTNIAVSQLKSEFMVSYDNYIANSETDFLTDLNLTEVIGKLLEANKKVICVLETCYAEGLIDLETFSEQAKENLAIFSSSTKANKTFFIRGLNSFFFMALTKVISSNPQISLAEITPSLNQQIAVYKAKYPTINIEPVVYIGQNVKNEKFI